MRGRPLHDTLGIEVLDFDITRPASPEDQAELRRLFCQHHLLLIRGQTPTNEDHDRFCKYFGPLSLPPVGADSGYVSNVTDKQETKVGQQTGTDELLWHADGTYGPHPGIGTSLFAKEVTPGSAPTLYLNAVHALKTLPARLRERIASLKAMHMRDTQDYRTAKPYSDKEMQNKDPKQIRAHEHPIIYRPPHNDVDVLYVNRLLTSHITGLPRDEADALMEELFTHLYDEKNAYTHQWQLNDVIIWDNIALQHRRPAMGAKNRHLRRVSLDGWNTGNGTFDWFASGTRRDNAVHEGRDLATA
jgi:taurine dioxygenase